MKKKQFYEKPSMRVCVMRQRPQLLAGSNGEAEVTPMDDPEDLE